MMRYPDIELLNLLDQTESDLTERKESWKGDAPEKSRQAVCAFANDLSDHRKPGVLFVGVKDDGTPTNLLITDELLQTLGAMKTDGKIVPPPTIVVEKRTLKGSEVAVVTVQPADASPVRHLIRERHFNNLLVTPLCIALTKARTLQCEFSGLMTVLKSPIPEVLTARSPLKTSANLGLLTIEIHISPKP